MSYSSDKKHKLIFENWRKFVSEDADPTKQSDEDFPLKLSDVGKKYTSDDARNIATGGSGKLDGEESDDVIKASPVSVPCKKLKPSQSSMNIGKAVAFAIAAILKNNPFPEGPGGNLGAIITNDNHIMDGHHRWIASGMINPSSKVGGFVVQYPAKKLIPVLNVLTVHFTKSAKGKKGGGSFKDFNAQGILRVLQKYAKEGVWSAKGDPAMVIKALEQFSGQKGEAAIRAAAEKMAQNVSQLTLSVPSGFPQREDMPVISAKKGHLALAVKLLNSGMVDVNPPFKGGAKDGPGGTSSFAKGRTEKEMDTVGQKMMDLYREDQDPKAKRRKK